MLRHYRATWKLLRQWGYQVKVGWWGQSDIRVHADIDELDDLSQIQLLSVGQFEAIATQCSTLLHKLKDLLGRLGPKEKAEGFTPPAVLLNLKDGPKTNRRIPTDEEKATLTVLLKDGNRETRRLIRKRWILPRPSPTQIHIYQPGDRLLTWRDAIDRGYQYVLDQSQPGTGKSYDSGRVQLSDFDVRQVIYLSDQHRNPTVETLEYGNGWSDLEARHRGLCKVASPGGTRWQRTGAGDLPSISPNCSRNGLLNALRSKNIPGADTASLICGTCPLREPCTHSNGPGYGYLNQRHTALATPSTQSTPR